MDEVVNRNIFFTKEGDIVETVGVRIVVTNRRTADLTIGQCPFC